MRKQIMAGFMVLGGWLVSAAPPVGRRCVGSTTKGDAGCARGVGKNGHVPQIAYQFTLSAKATSEDVLAFNEKIMIGGTITIM